MNNDFIKKNKELVYTIEYITLAILSILTLFLPYLKLSVTVNFFGSYTESETATGWDLFKGASYLKDLSESNLAELVDYFEKERNTLLVMIVLFVVLPVLLMLINAIVHGVFLYKKKYTWKLAFLPAISVTLMALGQILMVVFVKYQLIKTIAKRVEDGVSSFGGILNSDDAIDTLNSIVKVHMRPQVGFYLFLTLGIIMFVEDIIFSSKMEKIAERLKSKDINITTWTNSSLFGKNADFKGKMSGGRAKNGMIIGIRGEYQGAQIPVVNGEWVEIGRSTECNLILSSQQVSRRHCRLSFDEKGDTYLLINYSMNGTFLGDGKLLEKEMIYRLPHGSVFRVGKQDEFRVL